MTGKSAPAAEAAPAPATEAAPAWVLNAPDIAIEGASMDVEDGLVKPAAKFKLAPIDVKVGGYSNAPGTQVQVDAAMGIDGNAKLAAKGQVALDTPACPCTWMSPISISLRCSRIWVRTRR